MQQDIILEKQNLSYLSWARVRNSSGTAGSYLKSYSDLNGRKVYYKLSYYDAYKGIIGHESVNELIVDRLLTILGVEHLHYQLIHADVLVDGQRHDTYLCASDDFKKRGESKIALDAYYQYERNAGESPLDFCLRNGWAEFIWKMLVVDFLMLNRDRHGANMEVLRNSKERTIRLAPLFDHGLSLMYLGREDKDFLAFDMMQDKPAQCYVGSNSTKENLLLIPKGAYPQLNPLRESSRDYLFTDLETVLSPVHIDRIWEMIWRRWTYYEDFCNQR